MDKKSPRKRLRKIWSCLECRRRRLHCDRVSPICGRCAKSGTPSKCRYLHNESELPTPVSGRTDQTKIFVQTQSPDSPKSCATGQGTAVISLQGLADSIETLGRVVTETRNPEEGTKERGPSNASPGIQRTDATSCSNVEAPHDRGIDQATTHSYNTSCSRMVDRMPGLRELTKEAFTTFPVMENIRQALQESEIEILQLLRPAGPIDISALRYHLPPRKEADALIESYFESIGAVYDVLDRPSFQGSYEDIWKADITPSPSFLIVALLIIAMARCPQSTSIMPSTDGTLSQRDQATAIILACQQYMEQHSSRRNSLAELQAGFLLLLAQQINARRFKETYANAGKLIRTFMAAGLNQNRPQRRGQPVTALETDLRNRLWVAAVEFELQAAFEQGMPPMALAGETYGGLDERCSTTARGSSRNGSSQTFHSSLQVRRKLCHHLNAGGPPLQLNEVRVLSETLASHLAQLQESDPKQQDFVSTVASLNIRQYLLALHQSQLEQDASGFLRDAHQGAVLRNALAIINTYGSIGDAEKLALDLMYGHQIRAALVIAQLYLADPPGQDFLLRSFSKLDAHRLMDVAIRSVQRRSTCFTSDQRQLWTVLAAAVLMRIPLSSGGIVEELRKAVERYQSAFEIVGLLINHTRKQPQDGTSNNDPLRVSNDSMTLSSLSSSGNWTFDDWFMHDWDMELVLEQ